MVEEDYWVNFYATQLNDGTYAYDSYYVVRLTATWYWPFDFTGKAPLCISHPVNAPQMLAWRKSYVRGI